MGANEEPEAPELFFMSTRSVEVHELSLEGYDNAVGLVMFTDEGPVPCAVSKEVATSLAIILTEILGRM